MADVDGVFMFVGTYPDEASAQADYDVVKALHGVDVVGGFDAAVVTKDAKGKVHVNKDETSTRKGAWGGIAVGALVGLLFPPSLLATGAIGGVIGGVAGHLFGGMSRSDVKELGELIDEGEAALVVIGDLTVEKAVEKAQLHAVKTLRKQIDLDTKALEKEIQEAHKN